jgi:hypothetical protein
LTAIPCPYLLDAAPATVALDPRVFPAVYRLCREVVVQERNVSEPPRNLQGDFPPFGVAHCDASARRPLPREHVKVGRPSASRSIAPRPLQKRELVRGPPVLRSITPRPHELVQLPRGVVVLSDVAPRLTYVRFHVDGVSGVVQKNTAAFVVVRVGDANKGFFLFAVGDVRRFDYRRHLLVAPGRRYSVLRIRRDLLVDLQVDFTFGFPEEFRYLPALQFHGVLARAGGRSWRFHVITVSAFFAIIAFLFVFRVEDARQAARFDLADVRRQHVRIVSGLDVSGVAGEDARPGLGRHGRRRRRRRHEQLQRVGVLLSAFSAKTAAVRWRPIPDSTKNKKRFQS